MRRQHDGNPGLTKSAERYPIAEITVFASEGISLR